MIARGKDSLRQAQKNILSLRQATKHRLLQLLEMCGEIRGQQFQRGQEILGLLGAFQEIVCGEDLYHKLLALLGDTLQMKNVRHSQIMKEAQDIHITEVSMMHREFKDKGRLQDM